VSTPATVPLLDAHTGASAVVDAVAVRIDELIAPSLPLLMRRSVATSRASALANMIIDPVTVFILESGGFRLLHVLLRGAIFPARSFLLHGFLILRCSRYGEREGQDE
jgi:hypothetical protein